MSKTKTKFQEQTFVNEVLKPSSTIDRRQIFVAAGFIGAAAIVGTREACAQQVASAAPIPNGPPPDTLHGSMKTALGRSRPTFVKDLSQMVDLNATNQGGAYWNYRSYMTPIEQFFIRNEFSTPRAETDQRVDKTAWRLKIHGNAVERELTLSYDDLLRMPSRSIIATMECAGNGRSLFWEQQGMTTAPTEVGGTGWGLGGIGQAEWQFVAMSQILSRVGLKKDAKQALFWSGVDNKDDKPGALGDRGRPLPVSVLTSLAEHCGLAFKMNGQDLPADHGAPVRMIVPGWCGAGSTKWITEIKIANHNFWVPLNTVAHVKIGPAYPPPQAQPGDEFRFASPDRILGQAVEWSPPKSLITVPLVLEKQPKHPHNYPLRPGEVPKLVAGQQMMAGYAWAPRYGTDMVEYRIDGADWQGARILGPNMGRFTWVRFQFPWLAKPGRHLIETRVTDLNGATQPDTVPFNKGGFDYWAVPKFHIDVV